MKNKDVTITQKDGCTTMTIHKGNGEQWGCFDKGHCPPLWK